ncbi:hypothetical protein AXY43_03935 [Clostridium sp. MF28]|uniref:hypothetical protein n=1 Tax=Clostridium TaxID=1485 RepID=UPI000CF85A84|nr:MULTISPECIES: hypothetical protein [Clostridium]AVK51373.1 hypothetical protein AXY43_03935 [Clostridium sp. MF28]PSM56660.1 hypothetical protein C4L39_16670 [Clostridium diolis]
MKSIIFEGWKIEIDKEKTKNYYSQLYRDGLRECCSDCRNYYYGIRHLPKVFIDFLESLFIVPETPICAYKLDKVADNIFLYDVNYLISGNILEKPDNAENASENGKKVFKTSTLTDEVEFYFTKELYPSLRNLSGYESYFELQLFCEIPWVIDEPYE